ncbi:hypothetical protein NG796_07175 [Laspinema sp. A4]|nr:hypothetical protein [Laspinema sp. D2d]MCT7983072.1 hypothetical protein [Laspinema sp. D2d]
MGKQDLLGPFKLGDRTTKSAKQSGMLGSIPCINNLRFEKIEAMRV